MVCGDVHSDKHQATTCTYEQCTEHTVDNRQRGKCTQYIHKHLFTHSHNHIVNFRVEHAIFSQASKKKMEIVYNYFTTRIKLDHLISA